ncbi:phenylalanine--tRNA ligase subunit beta [Wolbachia endosymbiont of Atemnus politus]|uniref:phenylalanine--tRNA ligase subunit beta n=1 Tax=Wolbachia endosymbiont of Atemnus politus TaxID=2682840 RepID=UPI001571D3D4|nr:phenylalanine--tRNA ligase subunit beta [Wolbachia endosymbiont of Atemnus politus]NSM56907.1 phenylalanine--tRNA ligase subunit beta [Wolbachia endosymbiont of Atemnus politus]NSX83587.1 phenylalanine--tRNA ligase subunit beta [Wolbachia endosymbiont of Atemnus politus]
MKFTLSWLLEHLETNASLEEITDKLTHIGLEVEDVIDNAKLAGFVVAKVLEVVPHPNADKLKLCKVDDGNKVLQIVCGAQNVREDMKTVLASLGSTLPDSDFTIKPAKIRGVSSEGMLCSASELALIQEESEGIIELSDDYKVGDKFFNCDPVIDINVTTNRGDCLGVYGIARDLAATGIGTLKALSVPQLTCLIDSPNDVKVTDEESFISGVYIANVKNKESPKWLKDKLESIGMRSISAIVDITNYIMISFGRPMHAYDAKKIEGELVVRKANSGEKFTGLNGKEYLLNKDVSIISDDKNIHAIAGIIGGKYSECTLETTDIFLESAWFDPISVTKSSRQLCISTDSSYRFARSVDPGFTFDGLHLAAQMILELCGGEASSVVSAGSLDKADTKVNFDYQDVNKFGSVSASPDEIFDILTKLGFSIDKRTESNWSVQVPSWRPDVAIPADLVEEVVRIYGYDKIKEEPLTGNVTVETNAQDDLRILMTSRGFHEVLTWSFMSESTAEKFGYSDKLFIIDNPFNNNFNIMRPSIMPNLLQVTADNIAHGTPDLAIFEIGPVYDSLNQPKYVLSGIRSGNNLPRNHYNTDRKVDVFDAKADLITALEFFNINCNNFTIERAEKEYYHPGKSGIFSFKSKTLGYFGELHPSILDFFNIKQKVVGFEVILEDIENLPVSRKKFIDYKYQSVKRDFAFIVNQDVAAGNIINMVRKSSELIMEVLIFDVYHDIEPNKMSIALSVTFCSPTHTLTEEEIQKESSAIVNLVSENIGGVLRYS